jgi:hypothetical protein
MKTEVTATIVGGSLKLDKELPLPEQTRVKVTIEPIVLDTETPSPWESLKARLRERPIHAGGKRYTRDELHERD